MAELSFLTIIISLAVCSLLIYAVFQYTKIRLTVLEQSHKEQALILQQFIEESSTDIHRLYQLSSNNGSRNYMQPQDSIILEYANDSEPILTILVTSTKWSKCSMPKVLQLSFVILTRVVAFFAITTNHDDKGYSTVETLLQPIQMQLYSC